MINIEAELRVIVLFLLIGLMSAVETKVKTEKKREGETVTLHFNITELQTDAVIVWLFGPVSPDVMIARLLIAENTVKYPSERFRDRLQVDKETGSLTISNLNTNDSGVYQLEAINAVVFRQKFNLSVYTPVSKPVIRNTPQSCSVLCSVENGREVTLSWQREGETLSHTSSPDLNTPLSLPLRIEEHNYTYICVAANPVSEESLQLNTEKLCSGPDQVQRSYIVPAVLVPAILILITGLIIFFMKQRKRRGTEGEGGGGEDRDTGQVQYSEVRRLSEPTETEPSGGAHADPEDTDRVEHAEVVT
ncbi:hypothetical protein MATL_G00221430 [Megalops atlanticus]|uniref:Ig-like domain-containing protein n=1 Tax=Megalops atlanticus TaxID=7932 RepID=A0A9D3T2X5_MEGAT|nr:hypothetical protein MATL_G00221430 [Megalops atlanticus]